MIGRDRPAATRIRRRIGLALSASLAVTSVGLALAGFVLADDADDTARHLTAVAIVVGIAAVVVLLVVDLRWPTRR